jgi:hypothetical protein
VNVDVTATFPADPETVFEMLRDPEYVSEKALAMFATSHEVDITGTEGGGATIALTRVLPAKVPDAMKRLVGETITVHQTDTWMAARENGMREAELEATIERVPSTIHGKMRLAALPDGGTELRVRATIKGNVPFVGRKIESAAADIVGKAARKEEQVGREWLAARH